jgi:hypothetical protein
MPTVQAGQLRGSISVGSILGSRRLLSMYSSNPSGLLFLMFRVACGQSRNYSTADAWKTLLSWLCLALTSLMTMNEWGMGIMSPYCALPR